MKFLNSVFNRFVLFFGILLVQDAVLLMLERDAAEAIMRRETRATVVQFMAVPAGIADDSVGRARAADRLITNLPAIITHAGHVHRT